MGFDAIAKYYDGLAVLVFGKSLKKAQTYFLNRIPLASNVLVIGGGTGWWLKDFLRQNPNCKVFYVEQSEKMLALAKKATDNDSRISFVCGTEDSITMNEFDVIIVFFFLDIFSDATLNVLLEKLKMLSKSTALWLVADFVNSTRWHSLFLFAMYRFFRFTTRLENQKLPDWQNELIKRNLREVDHRLFFGNFIKTALYKVC